MNHRTRAFFGLCALCLAGADAVAHQVDMAQTTQQATVLTLSYADGSPFAYEAFELFRGDGKLPVQLGRTDAEGRVLFLPDRAGEWRLKAFSEDGHGLEVRFEAAPGVASSTAQDTPEINFAAAIMTGFGILFGIFGLHQLFMRRRRQKRV